MTTLPSFRPGLAKRRSRRLRKKLHIAEFQALGFEYDVTWQTFPTIAQQDDFLDAFVVLIESRDLELGGGPTSGFVCGVGKNPSLADMKAVQDFLSGWPGVEQVAMGAMIDAWYDQPDDDDPALGQFLGFLERDMASHPEHIQPLDASLIHRIQSLFSGVAPELQRGPAGIVRSQQKKGGHA